MAKPEERCGPTAVVCLSGQDLGGFGIDALKLARIFARACDTTLVCKHGSALHKAAQVQLISKVCPIRFFSKHFSPSVILTLRRLLRRQSIRNIVFLGATELKSIFFAVMGLPVNVIVRHGTTKSRPKRDFLHRWIYGCVSHHVAISEHLARNVVNIVPFRETLALSTIYPSLGAGCTARRPPPDDTLRIVHVGRLAEGKGQRDAIEACFKLEEEQISFRLRLCGEGPCDEELRRLIATRPLPSSYELMGLVQDVPSVLAESDVFLFPSLGEGFGNAFAEGLGAGLVCLAYRNTAFPEFKSLGFHLHLVEDRRTDLLGDELLAVAHNLATELSQASTNVERARKIFSPEHELSEYLRLMV